MKIQISPDDLFERRIVYPDIDQSERLNRLIGIDKYKEKLVKILALLVNPDSIKSWMEKYHPNSTNVVNLVMRRPPLIILAGDVGSGKSELAESIGDSVARQENVEITLFPLSLSTRGQGRVGEMTQLLSAAFEYTVIEANKLKSRSGRARGAVILLIDEADSLAQSRESTQMHHEDRAGVNAFIRGIDRIANNCLPAAVIMCTNRPDALDPAVRRRAADIMVFSRPNKLQRTDVLSPPLKELGFSQGQIESIVNATGEQQNCSYGFTFSDLTQRLLPEIVLDAYPTRKVDPERATEIALSMSPTIPFQDSSL